MIEPTKKRLSRIFTFIIVGFNLLILFISFLFLHQGIVGEVRRNMREELMKEFLDQFHRSGLTPFGNAWDDHHFQILTSSGETVISPERSRAFYPGVNPDLMRRASEGREGFEKLLVAGEPHFVLYFPIDGTYVGRLASSLTEAQEYEKGFVRIILIAMPGMILLSYLVSRFLVNHAMSQISDFFTFQETFSSNVTHELRSPLASLKGNLEVALRKERSTGDYQKVLRLGLKEVDRIIALLNNLYLLASSRFKPLDLFKHHVNVKSMVDDVLRANRRAIESRGITVHVTNAADVSCMCDQNLIRRTVENIFDNAVKYTPPAGSISVDLAAEDKKLRVTVTNTCEELSGKERENLFSPFYRGKNTLNHDAEGKGLGLYIARYIVRSHGGDIAINNTYGSLFSLTMTLPRT